MVDKNLQGLPNLEGFVPNKPVGMPIGLILDESKFGLIQNIFVRMLRKSQSLFIGQPNVPENTFYQNGFIKNGLNEKSDLSQSLM